MSVIGIRHVTTYRYRQPVTFGEHRMMFRPRESYDQRLLEARVTITPEPVELRYVHDVFGNCVGIARFSGWARELTFDSYVRLEQRPDEALDEEAPEDLLSPFPFAYSAEELPDLARSIERSYPDPDRALERWARRFVHAAGPLSTHDVLAALTRAIPREFTYIGRHERGVQTPSETLRLGRGTCRDFAVLMMEAARTLGLAARFVSGYLCSAGDDDRQQRGGGHTHAWVRIYLPTGGWVEFDPTNGIIGNRNLIRVAVVRDPAQATPLHGSWQGFPADYLGMDVKVEVKPERPGIIGVVAA